jgi:NTE family protein
VFKSVKTINLALQGGGSHSAFTWGVLDRLLQEEALRIEGISGTSGGALNAAYLLQGYADGGAAGARKALDDFWHCMGGLSTFGVAKRSIFDQMFGNWNIDTSPAAMMMEMMGRNFSPYQSNPLNLNPVRDILNETLDIAKVRNCAAFKLFVAATNVETGRVRLFTRDEISVDVLMASTSIPFNVQAVKIDGVPYWDGGYTGNPSLSPLVHNCVARDIAIIQLIPFVRKGTPTSLSEIINRLDEISFNSSLLGEVKALCLVQRLIDDGALKPNKEHFHPVYLHAIGDEQAIAALGATSKVNAEMDFLLHLKKMGYDTADKWIAAHWNAIGENSTLDIRKSFSDRIENVKQEKAATRE